MKNKIKALYIQKLQATYPFYVDGSRPLELANQAADKALAGKVKLQGECWESAVREATGLKTWTMATLAGLEE